MTQLHNRDVVKTCSVEGCERITQSRGYCGMHYQRILKFGVPGPAQPLIKDKGGGGRNVCGVPGCGRISRYAKMCNMHYLRERKFGDVGQAEPLRRPRGMGHISKHGYVVVYAPGRTTNGSRFEHQIVMEEHLGRALLPGETVHHRNGVRHDNRIENLQLRSGYHPRGATVKDHVDWAWQILERYGMIADDLVAR